ncbi:MULTISPECIES: histidine phosphatase family protein [unclassified Ruegeria]|uniref:histidine phosphatase family protein n=1 Tax=unclassified Ruegeria TaxID=2625375 RepID=UPI00148907FC|nr:MULTISPECIES: histidine phosphatase family protein [unclassified Ruegeria]
MAELLLVRHAQASFGADNYDKLSDLGHRQSAQLGDWLQGTGWVPDRLITGTLARHAETLASMGFSAAPERHAGLNEYDFKDLLNARFGGDVPQRVQGDRKTHFRALRETILHWQEGGLPDASESWAEFSARVAAALRFVTQTEARRVLVVSSGGPIGQITSSVLNAPNPQMMELNLQLRNTSQSRFLFSSRGVGLTEFNAIPHLHPVAQAEMITHS